MLLRPRQDQFVTRATEALVEKRNTLGVAPTGCGKSIMLSATVDRFLSATKGERALVIQHRDELTDQNRTKFRRVNGNRWSTGVFNASVKNTDRDVIFGMVATLARNLDAVAKLNPQLVVIDEAHHTAAGSYLKVLAAVKAGNDSAAVFGVTATPERGDSKTLREVFDNICDQITLGELIRQGHLVRPRTFVIDLGVTQELQAVDARRGSEQDKLDAAASILDKTPLTERVVEEWKKVAELRRTIVFAPTVAHAEHVAEVFNGHGVSAAAISGKMAESDRRAALGAFDAGKIQILVNCAVLTEGYDSQPVSCVVLLRPSSNKSTMIQMIGRGLRPVDPEVYPGVEKHDCIVLDFGTSVLTHGSLEQEATLGHDKGKTPASGPKKLCPECFAEVPANAFTCGLCGHVFIVRDPTAPDSDKGALEDFVLTEIDIFNQSPFRWEELWDGACLVANALEAWGVCLFYKGRWYAVGGSRELGMRLLSKGERLECVAAADDFLRVHGDGKMAAKAKAWIMDRPTEKQWGYLGNERPADMTRYRASCFLTMQFNGRGIQGKVKHAAGES